MTNRQLLLKIMKLDGNVDYLKFKITEEKGYCNLYCLVFRTGQSDYSIEVEYDEVDKEKIKRRLANASNYIKDHYKVL